MSLPRKSRKGYYDLKYVLQVAGTDEGFVLEMVKYFVQNTPVVLQRLKKYCREENWNDLAAEAHKFAPGLSFLGITVLEEKIRRVEDCATEGARHESLPRLVEEIDKTGNEVVNVLKQDFSLE
ncbi:MAG TPA: Hpt domain-containing protein [Bacteroidetes bacterium]|nr:Hpt domain-containing protein [Bacteroidota bacterium]